MEFARLTGMDSTHVNKLRNYESSGRTSVGAEIVRLVKDGLKVDPLFFFEDYDDSKEGVRDYRLYLLSAKRDEKRVSALEEAKVALETDNASLRTAMASMNEKLVRIEQRLADAGKQGASVNQKRR